MARRSRIRILAASVVLVQPPALAADQQVMAEAVTTQVGIALDAPWKRQIYAFARKELLHPAWGWSHSERNYQLAVQIAAQESLTVDTDVLFAASFTHDIGAIGEFQKEGVDHAVRSVELAEPMLLDAGFPAEKLPAVRAAIMGHMHDRQPGSRSEAIVLHDADTLDFLGVVGIARRLLVNGSAPDYVAGLARIEEFEDKLPARVITRTAKIMAQSRAAEMRSFLDQLKAETADGRLP